jgi:putative addiction module component (TIGR02574 family)
MSAIFDELSSKAMALSTLERARLADLMVESLDAAPLTDVDQAWINLAQRRADEIRAGTAKTYSAEEVLSEARRSIGR